MASNYSAVVNSDIGGGPDGCLVIARLRAESFAAQWTCAGYTYGRESTNVPVLPLFGNVVLQRRDDFSGEASDLQIRVAVLFDGRYRFGTKLCFYNNGRLAHEL